MTAPPIQDPLQDPIQQEFAALAARAGLPIPDGRLAGMAAQHAELMAMAASLRAMGLTPADEPANPYSFAPILRGSAA